MLSKKKPNKSRKSGAYTTKKIMRHTNKKHPSKRISKGKKVNKTKTIKKGGAKKESKNNIIENINGKLSNIVEKILKLIERQGNKNKRPYLSNLDISKAAKERVFSRKTTQLHLLKKIAKTQTLVEIEKNKVTQDKVNYNDKLIELINKYTQIYEKNPEYTQIYDNNPEKELDLIKISQQMKLVEIHLPKSIENYTTKIEEYNQKNTKNELIDNIEDLKGYLDLVKVILEEEEEKLKLLISAYRENYDANPRDVIKRKFYLDPTDDKLKTIVNEINKFQILTEIQKQENKIADLEKSEVINNSTAIQDAKNKVFHLKEIYYRKYGSFPTEDLQHLSNESYSEMGENYNKEINDTYGDNTLENTLNGTSAYELTDEEVNEIVKQNEYDDPFRPPVNRTNKNVSFPEKPNVDSKETKDYKSPADSNV